MFQFAKRDVEGAGKMSERKLVFGPHVENRGKELHELTAPAFFKAVELRNPEALNSDRTELVLQPGEQKDLYFIPRQAGRYAFTCADHDWAGMTGVMTIQ